MNIKNLIFGTELIKENLFAGNSTLTVESGLTGKHFTYKIKKDKDKELYYVKVLTGSDNTKDYTYMGIIVNNNFMSTKGSKILKNALSYTVFEYLFNSVKNEKVNPKLHVYHDGTCSCCGRKLTNPESLRFGIGEYCRNKK